MDMDFITAIMEMAEEMDIDELKQWKNVQAQMKDSETLPIISLFVAKRELEELKVKVNIYQFFRHM